MKWLRSAAIVLAGILVAVGFGMLGRSARKATKAESRTERLLSEGTAKALKKAVKESAKAEAFKNDAKAAAKVGKKALDGVKDEEIATVISKWTKP